MKPFLRILNIEDDENDAELNAAMLSARWPHSVLVRVADKKSLLEVLEDEEFDVILSDYTMPGFNGMEALTIVREKCPETPFVFVSGTIGEDGAIEALKNGATDYVLKHRLVRLIPVVDRALHEAEEHVECQRAEEAMRQSENKYRQLFECLTDAAFLAEDQTGKIIDANRAASKMLGCPRDKILGRKQSEFLALDKARYPASQPSLNPTDSTAFECEMIRADGTRTMVEVRPTPLELYGRALTLRLCHQVGKLGAR